MPFFRYNKRNKIPGVSGKRVPGAARMPPANMTGFHFTRVPFISEHPSGQAGSAVFREHHRQQIRNSRGQFAGAVGFAWQGLQEMDEAFFDWGQDLQRDVEAAVRQLARDMEQWAKQNAPWEDETGLAREKLQAVVVPEQNGSWSIWLGHGKDVYYGIWLEVRWGGRYAIVLPTIYHFAPQIGARIASQT